MKRIRIRGMERYGGNVGETFEPQYSPDKDLVATPDPMMVFNSGEALTAFSCWNVARVVSLYGGPEG